MEAKNLRIGNFINDSFGKYYQLGLIQLSNLDIMKLYPIQLTEKWLLDLGFEYDGRSYVVDLPIFNKLIVMKVGTPYIILIESICPKTKEKNKINLGFPCGYVHELQNLFFALTGEELELKEEVSA